MIDKHTAVAVADNVELGLREGQLTFDESWSPYIQGSILCPLPADPTDLEPLDPRLGARLEVRVQRDFGDTWSNADFTAAHTAPTSNADLTAAYGGWTNAQITAQFFKPWNPFGVRESQFLTADLGIRSRRIDHADKTVAFDLASDEALLQDVTLLAEEPYSLAADTTGRALVNFVLAEIGAELEPGTFDFVIDADATQWLPGVDAYRYLQPVLEANAARLWCDERRRWWLTEREPSTIGHLTLSSGDNGNLVAADDTIDRDGAEWFGSVVIRYRWVDSEGATHQAWDTAGTEYPTLSLDREQPYPGPGAAAAMLDRARGRGRVLNERAVSDYNARPGQSFTASLPGTPVQTGVVQGVAFEWPAAEMQVKTRGLIDTPTTAWVFDPPGERWIDIPVGVDWTEDI